MHGRQRRDDQLPLFNVNTDAAIGFESDLLNPANHKQDRFNRQLHEDNQAKEKTLAKQIADKSGGMYTQAQVEDQMRITGGLFGDSRESGAPSTLIGQTPSDSGAQWISGGKTEDGKTILTQITAQPDQALQSYILANAGSMPGGDVPNIVYDQIGKKGFSVDVTGPFTKFDQSDVDYVRNTTADASAMISTNAGRFSAATATAAATPSPYSAGFAAAAYGATVVIGVGADVLAQMVKPNVGQYAISGVTGLIAGNVSDRFPMLSPAVNETAITFNNSGSAQKAQDSLNNYWSQFVNYWSGKR
ncbi:hypothetical protein ASG35_22350 [Burkholderia sp. Leaf177]|uniref:hypothetical protein n=1 Tax=Burkholderia sp. Leaf177 TaxID=1736287 RepID=UPI0006FA92BB|nr:hypothetical protein [Burkholderia sp. Leaf177]KQR73720.1 hypothetical protein ASG35_22350 [Burkholderia sp. Leaf177]